MSLVYAPSPVREIFLDTPVEHILDWTRQEVCTLVLDGDKLPDIEPAIAFCERVVDIALSHTPQVHTHIVILRRESVPNHVYERIINAGALFYSADEYPQLSNPKQGKVALMEEEYRKDFQLQIDSLRVYKLPEGERRVKGIFQENGGCTVLLTDLGLFCARARDGTDLSVYLRKGQQMVSGKLLRKRVDYHGCKRVLQIFDVHQVEKIVHPEISPEELRAQLNGPFMGRLNRPDVFGANPDLYGKMTDEQFRQLLYPDDGGYGCD